MKIAITGGTGFVGRHLARTLVSEGHEVVLLARGVDQRETRIRQVAHVRFMPVGLSDEEGLVQAFAGCDGIAHCAGINRELGAQTYQRVHVEGTQRVVNAAKRAGVNKVLLLSFLRARPACSSAYHESKWAAEEIVRSPGLDYTVLKAGIIYGRGDHMLDHLSHTLHTFPVFAGVGLKEQSIRPVAVEDVARIMRASLIKGRLSRQTVAVTGPEELTLSDAVRRIGRVIAKRPIVFPMPVAGHYLIAWVAERLMQIPLISVAQVRMLAEGIVKPTGACDPLPEDLVPTRRFTDEQIRQGLPEPGPFSRRDLR